MANTSQRMTCLVLFHLFVSMFYLIIGICLLGLGLAERSMIPIQTMTVQLHVGNASVVFGVVMIISAFINCFSAVGRSRRFLEVYASIQTLIWVLMILVFAVLSDMDLQQKLRQALQDQLNSFDDSGGGSTDIPADINRIQAEFECCGVDSYKDWYAVHDHVPLSCCRRAGCNSYDPDAIFNEGCYAKLMFTIRQRMDKIVAVAITSLALQPIQIVSTFLLSRSGHTGPIYGPV